MNYCKHICQRTLLILCTILFSSHFIVSCSSVEGERTKSHLIEAEPVWFKAPERFTYKTREGNDETHPFFDLIPFEHKKETAINYVLLTEKDSPYGYDLDMVSGKPFKKYNYCPQKDVWDSYDDEIHTPPFYQGLVPRVLDSSGQPQRIIIFGDKEHFRLEKREKAYSQRAKIVGGLILQYCEDYPCQTRDKWLSTLVLVGVNTFDPRMKAVDSLEKIKKIVDWPYVKAFMENGYGRKVTGPEDEPAFRILGEVPAQRALAYSLSRGHYFKMDELNTMRSSCFKLYDYLWSNQQSMRKTIAKAKVDYEKSLVSKKKKVNYDGIVSTKLKFNRFIKSEVVTRDKKKEFKNFTSYFFDFYKNYGERYRTCVKFVRPSSIVENRERHWFFMFLNNFMNLERAGYYYICSKKGWVENSRLSSGKRQYDLSEPRSCTNNELDEAFDLSVTMMSGLKQSKRVHYRYISYDMGVGGSHEKIHSWVRSNGKVLSCTDKKYERADKSVRTFPQDIVWKSFKYDFRKSRYDIIR